MSARRVPSARMDDRVEVHQRIRSDAALTSRGNETHYEIVRRITLNEETA